MSEKYLVEEFKVNINNIYIDDKSNKIILHAFRLHPFSYYYLFILERLVIQSTIIYNKNPAIICNYICEQEFADPFVAYYSSYYGVKFHAFMHGDYKFQMDYAFMQYDCYWIWDEHYRQMFQNLKCIQPMKVYKPGNYKLIGIEAKNKEDCPYYATYYLSGEKIKSLNKIKIVFDKFRKKGKNCKLRPHPIDSNYNYIKYLFCDYLIETFNEYNLKQSLEDTYLVIALDSTVLFQAFYNGKIIVMDDICDKESYMDIKEKDYITYKQAQYLLSAILDINEIRYEN